MRAKDITRIALCTALMVICAWITIPITIPFTLQTMGVFISLLMLGGKKGTAAIMVYILLGVVGLPVFSRFRGGIGVLAGPTGGYITGFLLTGIVVWITEKILKGKAVIISLIAGIIICYTFGTAWFIMINKNTGFFTALGICVYPFIVPDLVKLAISFILCKKIKKST